MAAPGGGKKGGKKKKGKTVNLVEFLGQDTNTFVAPSRKVDWADESEDPTGEIEYAPAKQVDLSKLPSAPRASRGVEIDYSRLPKQPPYTAFLGNLPFDVTEDDIKGLFRGLRVENIRFPQDQGRMKGFGYAEFFDVEELKGALALSGEKIRNRGIRVDIADQAGKDGMSRDGMGERSDGDWRRDDGSGGGVFGQNRNDDRRDDRGGGFRGGERRGDDAPRRQPFVSAADSDSSWRRDDRSSENRSNGFGGDRYDRGGGRFDDRRGDDRDRGFRRYDEPRGGRFDDRRDFGGNRNDDAFGGSYRDSPRGGGFRDGPRDGGPFGSRDSGPRDGGPFGTRDGGSRDGGPFGSRDGGRRNYDQGDNQWNRDPPPPSRERPRLNLKPRTEPDKEISNEGQKSSNSIFGGARPVDTASKEREIEQKIVKEEPLPPRGRGEDRDYQRRDGSYDRTRRDNFSRDYNDDRDDRRNFSPNRYRNPKNDTDYRNDSRSPNYRDNDRYDRRDDRYDRRDPRDLDNDYRNDGDMNSEENWRDDRVRHDKPRVMRPDAMLADAEDGRERSISESSDKVYDDNNVLRKENRRSKSPRDKKKKEGPIIPPKYEEPEKPVFIQTSKFAALGIEDGDSENDEADIECP